MLHAYHILPNQGFFEKGGEGGDHLALPTYQETYTNVLTATFGKILGVFEQVHTCNCHFAAA